MLFDEVIATITSHNGLSIRLTKKQWLHLIESHDYMADNRDKVLETVHEPDYIVEGDVGELIALKRYSKTNISEKHCVVVYKELDFDGFVITAFLTSKPEKIFAKGVLWKRH